MEYSVYNSCLHTIHLQNDNLTLSNLSMVQALYYDYYLFRITSPHSFYHPAINIIQYMLSIYTTIKTSPAYYNYVRYKNWDGQIPTPKQKIKQRIYYNMEMP